MDWFLSIHEDSATLIGGPGKRCHPAPLSLSRQSKGLERVKEK
jgi:hypothetical protein